MSRYGLAEVDVELSHMSHVTYFERRRDFYETAVHSIELWETMTVDEQDILKREVAHSLSVMIDRMDEWLPEALDGHQQNELLQVTLGFLYSDVSSAVTKERGASSLALSEANEELQNRLAEMNESKSSKRT